MRHLSRRLGLATLIVAVVSVPAFAQKNQPEIRDNKWGGKSEVWTDANGRVTHQKDADDKKVVREDRTVEYGPGQDESEETKNYYDEKGRLTVTEKFKTKGQKRVSGTRTTRVYKDDNDPQGIPGEEMIVDPDTGNWTRPIPPVNVSLSPGGAPDDFSGGYTLKHFPGETYPLGGAVDFSHQIAQSPSVTTRVVGAFEFYHTGGDTFSAVLGGVRFGFHPTPTVKPFAEVTAGVAFWGTTDLALQYGGGADIKVGDLSPWQLRIAGGMATIIANGHAFNALRVVVGFSRPF